MSTSAPSRRLRTITSILGILCFFTVGYAFADDAPTGHIEMEWDAQKRLTRMQTPLGIEMFYFYDAKGVFQKKRLRLHTAEGPKDQDYEVDAPRFPYAFFLQATQSLIPAWYGIAKEFESVITPDNALAIEDIVIDFALATLKRRLVLANREESKIPAEIEQIFQAQLGANAQRLKTSPLTPAQRGILYELISSAIVEMSTVQYSRSVSASVPLYKKPAAETVLRQRLAELSQCAPVLARSIQQAYVSGQYRFYEGNSGNEEFDEHAAKNAAFVMAGERQSRTFFTKLFLDWSNVPEAGAEAEREKRFEPEDGDYSDYQRRYVMADIDPLEIFKGLKTTEEMQILLLHEHFHTLEHRLTELDKALTPSAQSSTAPVANTWGPLRDEADAVFDFFMSVPKTRKLLASLFIRAAEMGTYSEAFAEYAAFDAFAPCWKREQIIIKN